MPVVRPIKFVCSASPIGRHEIKIYSRLAQWTQIRYNNRSLKQALDRSGIQVHNGTHLS